MTEVARRGAWALYREQREYPDGAREVWLVVSDWGTSLSYRAETEAREMFEWLTAREGEDW